MNSQEYHKILGYLRGLVEGTQWEGHVYAVGGCCRDEIMGEPIKDIDLAVDLPGGGIGLAEWLNENKLIVNEPVTYPKFGTAMVVLKQFPDVELELVQTRKEKYTDKNSRCPETAFGSIEEDCMRRDLTVNSIFHNITTGKAVDITGKGLADINARLLRTPADPDVTFDDDPVRILRCIRFAARFGWEIDRATYQGMCRNVERLRIVSPRRLRMELEKMLLSPRPALAMELLRDTGAMEYVMPALVPLYELPTRYDGQTVWQHTLKTLTEVPDDIKLRWAALLLDTGKGTPVAPESKKGRPPHDLESRKVVWRILPRLRYDEDFIEDVAFIVRYHTFFKGAGDNGEKLSDVRLRKIQYQSGTTGRFDMLLRVVNADNMAYPDDGALSGQTAAIKRRSEELEAAGLDMFGYRLPVTIQRLRRIIHARTAKQVREAKDFLLAHAYENPLLSPEDAEKLLQKFRKASEKSRKQSNKKSNGGKNRSNVEKRTRG
ncbi:MAG: hypothetical protein K2L14_02065 [Duncaniella sp.]|nr:hypothetical protein [Duncaniella sp.]